MRKSKRGDLSGFGSSTLPAHLHPGRDRAELLQQGQHIKVEPRLDDLASTEQGGWSGRLPNGAQAAI
jgi:hypothetical protein